MEKELLKPIIEKYQYDDNLSQALYLVLDEFVKYYGEECIPELLELLSNTKIYVRKDITPDAMKEITNIEVGDRNKHFVSGEEENAYGEDNSRTTGSAYCFEIIYDENMNVTGEQKWFVIKDNAGVVLTDKLKERFNTTINIYYLIHELNHAYAMRNPKIVQNGNVVDIKHGMYVQRFEIDKSGQIPFVSNVFSRDVIMEEALNEIDTNKMFMSLLGVDDEKQMYEQMQELSITRSNYNVILTMIMDRMTGLFGDEIRKYRMDNDTSFIEKFNETMDTEIALGYFPRKIPFEYLSDCMKDIFVLCCDKYRHSVSEYSQLQGENMVRALAPIMAYSEHINGPQYLDKYNELRSKYGMEIVGPKR